MVFDDVDQDREQKFERGAIVFAFQITIERVEKPKRRVGGVIQALGLPIGKHVRDQTVAHVMRERAQDVARFEATAGDERQAFETDHRVASPIGEPMIAGDDGAHFVAGRVLRAPLPARARLVR